jgi:hypothetical protein
LKVGFSFFISLHFYFETFKQYNAHYFRKLFSPKIFFMALVFFTYFCLFLNFLNLT